MLVGWKQGEKTAEKSISVLGRKSEMKHGREMFVWGGGWGKEPVRLKNYRSGNDLRLTDKHHLLAY